MSLTTGTIAIICSSCVTALSVVVPIIKDLVAFKRLRHEELARFIRYASEQVFTKENLSAVSVDLWEHYGEVSYHCNYRQMKAIEKFIRTMEKSFFVFPSERKFAFRVMCFELSAAESILLRPWHRKKLLNALKKEKEEQDALERQSS